MNTHWQWSGRLGAACSLLFVALAPARAQEQGVLWETTAQTEIAGMPMKMPVVAGKHCAKQEWTEAPATTTDPTQNCKNTSYNRTGDKVTWTVACDNPPMTGDGELTFNGTDSYAGVIRMQASGMNLQMNLTGKKIGTCGNPT